MTIQECREKIWSIPPTRAKLNDLITSFNFSPANQEKDFGQIIPYVDYFIRFNESNNKLTPYFEYVSLTFYGPEFVQNKLDGGELVQSLYEHYLAPKSQKKTKLAHLKPEDRYKELQKLGVAPFSAIIFRNIDELINKIKI